MGLWNSVVCTKLTNSVSLGSEKCLKRWEVLTTSVCVCVHLYLDTPFDKHEEITIQRYQRFLSLAGGWNGAQSVIFSEEQRTRDDASYRFAHAHLFKHDTCMHAYWHTHAHTILQTHQGPGFESMHLTSDGNIPNRAGNVNIKKEKKEMQR